jgi:hypothetical protein
MAGVPQLIVKMLYSHLRFRWQDSLGFTRAAPSTGRRAKSNFNPQLTVESFEAGTASSPRKLATPSAGTGPSRPRPMLTEALSAGDASLALFNARHGGRSVASLPKRISQLP